MSTRWYLAAADPHRPASRARYVHHDGHPQTVIAALATIWQDTFGRDTAAMTAVLLAHDWSGLDPTGTGTAAGCLHISGVGYAYRDTGPPLTLPADPTDADCGPAQFAYLIHPDATVALFAANRGQWCPLGEHHLADGPTLTGDTAAQVATHHRRR